jgi:hypothetical protein
MAASLVLAIFTPAPEASAQRKTGTVLELVLDDTLRGSWTDADLTRLAEGNTGARWKNRKQQEVKTVPLATLLTEAAVSRDRIARIELHGQGKLVASLEGEELTKLQTLVLRKAPKPNKPWKLGALDPDRHPYGQPVLVRINVTTAAATR